MTVRDNVDTNVRNSFEFRDQVIYNISQRNEMNLDDNESAATADLCRRQEILF